MKVAWSIWNRVAIPYLVLPWLSCVIMHTQFSRHVDIRLTILPCGNSSAFKSLTYNEMTIIGNIFKSFARILNLNNDYRNHKPGTMSESLKEGSEEPVSDWDNLIAIVNPRILNSWLKLLLNSTSFCESLNNCKQIPFI